MGKKKQTLGLPFIHYPEHEFFRKGDGVKLDALRSLVSHYAADINQCLEKPMLQCLAAYHDMLKEALPENEESDSTPKEATVEAVPTSNKPGSNTEEKQLVSFFKSMRLLVARCITDDIWFKLKILPFQAQKELFLYWVEQGALGMLLHIQGKPGYDLIHCITEDCSDDGIMDLLRFASSKGQLHVELYIIRQLKRTVEASYLMIQATYRLMCLETHTPDVREAAMIYVRAHDPDAGLLSLPEVEAALFPATEPLPLTTKEPEQNQPQSVKEEEDESDTSESKSEEDEIPVVSETEKPDCWDKFLLYNLTYDSLVTLQTKPDSCWTIVANWNSSLLEKWLQDWMAKGRLIALHYVFTKWGEEQVDLLWQRFLLIEWERIFRGAIDQEQWHILLYVVYRVKSSQREWSHMRSLLPTEMELLFSMQKKVRCEHLLATAETYIRRTDPDAVCKQYEPVCDYFRQKIVKPTSPQEGDKQEEEQVDSTTDSTAKEPSCWDKSLLCSLKLESLHDLQTKPESCWTVLCGWPPGMLENWLQNWMAKGRLTALHYVFTQLGEERVDALWECFSTTELEGIIRKALKHKQWHILFYFVYTVKLSALQMSELESILPTGQELLSLLQKEASDKGGSVALESIIFWKDSDAIRKQHSHVCEFLQPIIQKLLNSSQEEEKEEEKEEEVKKNSGDKEEQDETKEEEVDDQEKATTNQQNALLHSLTSEPLSDLVRKSEGTWMIVYGWPPCVLKEWLQDWMAKGRLTALHYVFTQWGHFVVEEVVDGFELKELQSLTQTAVDHKQWHMLLYVLHYASKNQTLEHISCLQQAELPTYDDLFSSMQKETGCGNRFNALQTYVCRMDPDASLIAQVESLWEFFRQMPQNLFDEPHKEEEEVKNDNDEDSSISSEEEEEIVPASSFFVNFCMSFHDMKQLSPGCWDPLKRANYVEVFTVLLTLVRKNRLAALDMIQSIQQIDIVGSFFLSASDAHMTMLKRMLSKPKRLHICLYMKLCLCKPYSDQLPQVGDIMAQLKQDPPVYGSCALMRSHVQTHDPDYTEWISTEHHLRSIADIHHRSPFV